MTAPDRTPREHMHRLMSGVDLPQADELPADAPARSDDPAEVAERRKRRAVVKNLMDGVA